MTEQNKSDSSSQIKCNYILQCYDCVLKMRPVYENVDNFRNHQCCITIKLVQYIFQISKKQNINFMLFCKIL